MTDPYHTQESNDVVFDLSDVSYSIDNKEILSNLNLKIKARRVGIIGRNGSGKSTLARLLAGLIAPVHGKITLNGADMYKDRKTALTEIGIIFQNPDQQIIFPTVSEEISFGLRQLGHSKEDALKITREILNSFQMPHWENAYISTLSQGQKHLLCLMSVIAMKPSAILLDEPYCGLDIPTKHQLNRYLDQYHGSILHITHDPNDLENYEETIWIDQGRIYQTGPSRTVLAQYIKRMNDIGGSNDISKLSS